MPQGFQLGPIFIRYYGIILMLGALAGGWLAAREAKRRGNDPEVVWDMLIWLIIGGVIGARLWHVFTPSPSAIAEGRTTLFYRSGTSSSSASIRWLRSVTAGSSSFRFPCS